MLAGVAWQWSKNHGGENQLWAGSGSAGLRLKLKGLEFDWESPLHMQSSVYAPSMLQYLAFLSTVSFSMRSFRFTGVVFHAAAINVWKSCST